MKKILNKIKIALNYATGRELFAIYPSQVAVEVTNYCNLACTICPHKSMKRIKGKISLVDFKMVVDQVKEHAEFIFLYGIGESLLHHELCDMIDYAQNAGLYTYLSTNVVLMNEKWSESILKSKLRSITFAFDGCTKESYESIRIGSNFERCIENIKSFLILKERLKSKIEVIIQLVLTRENMNEVERFHGLFSKKELSLVNRIRIKPFYDSFPNKAVVIDSNSVQQCFFLWSFMFVYWNCKVGLCCMDYDGENVLGDLRREDPLEIWNSKVLQSIRRASSKKYHQGMPGVCHACSIPKMNYFSSAVVVASSFVPMSVVRKIIPIYEKIFINRKIMARSDEGR